MKVSAREGAGYQNAEVWGLKKLVSPSRKRDVVGDLRQAFGTSERRACAVVDQPRSSQRYQLQSRGDEAALTRRMRELVGRRPRFGYRRIGSLL